MTDILPRFLMSAVSGMSGSMMSQMAGSFSISVRSCSLTSPYSRISSTVLSTSIVRLASSTAFRYLCTYKDRCYKCTVWHKMRCDHE